ncbi:MAG: purine-nucleoside phosphorylase [Deltaproteobacteria bacterium]|nr:purine-nucleoside phosphorylase [Deltaproteobacteria bacterium]
MTNLYDAMKDAAGFLRAKTASVPVAALILGTGLGGVSGRIRITEKIPYSLIPHFPVSTVEGHEGNLLFGTLADVNIVVMQGRLHFYEGYSLQEVTLPVRVMRELGAELLFINSAAGGINPFFRAGDVMIVTDHINLQGDNPLRGVSDERFGPRFPDMSRPYDWELIHVAGQAALDLKIPVRYGVYAAVSGPSLETPSETRMLKLLGADAVGMSTAPEVIVARQIGFRTLVMAAITNVNLPDCMEPISIEKVMANASTVEPKLAAVLEETLRRAVAR